MPAKYLLSALLALALLAAAGAALLYLRANPSSPVIVSSKNFLTRQAGTLPLSNERPAQPTPPPDPKNIWFTNYKNSSVKAVNRSGQIVWEQYLAFPSANDEEPSNIEFATVAPNGNPLVTTANGMLIQELDRNTHEVVWKYGILNHQYCNKCLHQPKKAYLFNDHEVLVTDANNRRAIIIDKNTDEIIWQYGHTAAMGDAPGYLRGNRHAIPLHGGQQILISDTLQKKIIVVDRATNNIVWEWTKPDSQWLQNVYPTADGGYVGQDHLKADVFKVSAAGQLEWDIHALADGSVLKYPTDAIPLPNGNILIAEAGRGRIIEVNPQTKEIVWEFNGAGFVTAIDVEY